MRGDQAGRAFGEAPLADGDEQRPQALNAFLVECRRNLEGGIDCRELLELVVLGGHDDGDQVLNETAAEVGVDVAGQLAEAADVSLQIRDL